MTKKSYSEKLRDPRWQKKRLEILNRDEFTCQFCGEKEITLNIHHFCYDKSGNPWAVNDWDLVTVCEDCHHLIGKGSPEIIKDIMTVFQCADGTSKNGTISHFYKRWIIEIMLKHYPKNISYGKR